MRASRPCSVRSRRPIIRTTLLVRRSPPWPARFNPRRHLAFPVPRRHRTSARGAGSAHRRSAARLGFRRGGAPRAPHGASDRVTPHRRALRGRSAARSARLLDGQRSLDRQAGRERARRVGVGIGPRDGNRGEARIGRRAPKNRRMMRLLALRISEVAPEASSKLPAGSVSKTLSSISTSARAMMSVVKLTAGVMGYALSVYQAVQLRCTE